jgi:hypothetical protein
MKVIVQMLIFGSAVLVGWLVREGTLRDTLKESAVVYPDIKGVANFEIGDVHSYDGLADVLEVSPESLK